MGESVSFGVRIPNWLLEAIEKLRLEKGVSRNDVVMEALKEYVEREEAKP